MQQFGLWASYAGTARVWLAAVLLAAAAGLAAAGIWLPLPAGGCRPADMARPGPAPGAVRAAYLAWIAAMAAFVICVVIFFRQYNRDFHVPFAEAHAANPITPVTFLAAVVIFLFIMVRRSPGAGTRLVGAAVGIAAGLSFFEFPYQLIVWNRLSPPVPPNPALYRALIWVPLLLIEITTLLLLRLSPMARLTRTTFFVLALMLTVFAAWGLSGFGYPSSPLPTTLNIVAKLLSFAAAATLFVQRRSPETANLGPN